MIKTIDLKLVSPTDADIAFLLNSNVCDISVTMDIDQKHPIYSILHGWIPESDIYFSHSNKFISQITDDYSWYMKDSGDVIVFEVYIQSVNCITILKDIITGNFDLMAT